MKLHTFLTLSLALTLAACNRQPESSLQRIVFDAGDLKMMATAVNKKLETMSILYVNAPAYKAALTADGQHQAGEQFTLVTWKYHENPYFYGSNINGELLSVEKLTVQASTDPINNINYVVAQGEVLPVNGKTMNKEERIRYIFGYRPSIFP